MASPQNTLKLTQTNPYTTQNQNLDGVFRGALEKHTPPKFRPTRPPAEGKGFINQTGFQGF
jgi:hypothetical protein